MPASFFSFLLVVHWCRCLKNVIAGPKYASIYDLLDIAKFPCMNVVPFCISSSEVREDHLPSLDNGVFCKT